MKKFPQLRSFIFGDPVDIFYVTRFFQVIFTDQGVAVGLNIEDQQFSIKTVSDSDPEVKAVGFSTKLTKRVWVVSLSS